MVITGTHNVVKQCGFYYTKMIIYKQLNVAEFFYATRVVFFGAPLMTLAMEYA
jgi:hypothetical protein